MKNLVNKSKYALALVSTLPLLAHAQSSGPDYSTLTSAVDFSSAETAVMAIAAIVMGVLVVIKGIKWVKGLVRSA
ncbi:MAG TPA: major capsid protein [Trinickia sp.]|uniref:major capsid protein n=1 Tax=Trinickia sp. TaxID=2571163 RepID=UPI002BDE5651|nr:major capsid protein [Trinickia sp.]HVW49898.1 major capsid protein [Trinickia sp.]